MKVRLGFVSNSSSSSFVLVTTKSHFDKVVGGMHPFFKYVACEVAKEINNKRFGKVVALQTWENNGGYHSLDYLNGAYKEEIPQGEYGEITAMEAFYDIIDKLTENEDEVMTFEQDW